VTKKSAIELTQFDVPAVRGRKRLEYLRHGRGLLGASLLLFTVTVALVGPALAPDSIAVPIGLPGTGPSRSALLGTDFLGRDVLSRVLNGGRSVLVLSVLSIGLVYLIGIYLGVVAALRRESLLDPFVMRGVDLLMTFPPLLLLLVIISGSGSSFWTLLIGILLVLTPGVVRIVRSATLAIVLNGYIEAAITRGERLFALVRREILPNIIPTVLADLGLRFSGAVVLAASVSFLGLGAHPPASDWGLMISENRGIFSTNIWALVIPAGMLAILTISVNMIGDAYIQHIEKS
jgi:ABC-type dipeptide/oligopeptide/nickel transport system permease subunit